MTSLSTHVLDIERGVPAAGVSVSLYRADQLLTSAATGTDGRIADLGGGALTDGTYRLEFDVQAYLERMGRHTSFVEHVSVDFRVDTAQRHYHVPLLVSAYAATVYRGA
jgi:5-hydroxyisourate hydrolase